MAKDKGKRSIWAQKRRSLIMGTAHAGETAFSLDSETACENPLCDVRFPQTGMAISPKRFCCNECKQQASILRRAVKLLDGLLDDQVLEILVRVSRSGKQD